MLDLGKVWMRYLATDVNPVPSVLAAMQAVLRHRSAHQARPARLHRAHPRPGSGGVVIVRDRRVPGGLVTIGQRALRRLGPAGATPESTRGGEVQSGHGSLACAPSRSSETGGA